MRVVGKTISDCIVRTEHGDVSFHVHRAKSLNPMQGEEWHISDAQNPTAAAVIVKQKPFKRVVTFETYDGTMMAEMSHERFSTDSEITYANEQYRWHTHGRSNLDLLDSQNKKVASFQASGAMTAPWKAAADKITILSGCRDSIWMCLVIASSILEADRVGGRRWF